MVIKNGTVFLAGTMAQSTEWLKYLLFCKLNNNKNDCHNFSNFINLEKE